MEKLAIYDILDRQDLEKLEQIISMHDVSKELTLSYEFRNNALSALMFFAAGMILKSSLYWKHSFDFIYTIGNVLVYAGMVLMTCWGLLYLIFIPILRFWFVRNRLRDILDNIGSHHMSDFLLAADEYLHYLVEKKDIQKENARAVLKMIGQMAKP